MNKRTFFKITSGGLFSTMAGSGISLALAGQQKENTLKVGLISDLHFSKKIPDALERFKVFLSEANKQKPDYIIQLGDFCHFEDRSKPLMEVWRAYQGEKYHVLGNHDMDFGSKADIMGLWGMKKRFYDFDLNGWKFIVADMNHIKKGDKYIPYSKANFYVDQRMRSWPDPEQLEWLDNSLAKTDLPVIIYTHQPFAHTGAPQQAVILDVLKKHQTAEQHPKVKAVISGHQHSDWHREVHGTHHICINSASYRWSKKERRPYMYKDSLFSFMEIKNGKLTITGKNTTWAEKPEDATSNPAISDRSIKI